MLMFENRKRKHWKTQNWIFLDDCGALLNAQEMGAEAPTNKLCHGKHLHSECIRKMTQYSLSDILMVACPGDKASVRNRVQTKTKLIWV